MLTSILAVSTYLIFIIDAAHCCKDNMLIYNAKLHEGIEVCANEADKLKICRIEEEKIVKTQWNLYYHGFLNN